MARKDLVQQLICLCLYTKIQCLVCTLLSNKFMVSTFEWFSNQSVCFSLPFNCSVTVWTKRKGSARGTLGGPDYRNS